MNNPQEIVDFIGLARLRDALGVTRRRVMIARAAGKFPASWYDAMERLSRRPLPREWFSFKGDTNAR